MLSCVVAEPEDMSVKHDKKEYVRCSRCDADVQRNNLSRHLRLYCPLPVPQSRSQSASAVRCRSVRRSFESLRTSVSDGAGVTSHRQESFDSINTCSDYDELSPQQYMEASRATRAMLERRYSYDVSSLCQYLEDTCPNIPAVERVYLVVGAVAGAQHVANAHHAIQARRDDPKPERVQRVRDLRCAMATWASGPKEGLHDPRPISSAGKVTRRSSCQSVNTDDTGDMLRPPNNEEAGDVTVTGV